MSRDYWLGVATPVGLGLLLCAGHFRGSHRELVGACYDPDAECACKSYLTPQNARRAS